MFNIAQDPGEWIDRSGETELAEIEAELDGIVTGGYFDLEKIARDVWDRLPMKQVVNDAMKTNDTHWDYQVDPSASTQFVRS